MRGFRTGEFKTQLIVSADSRPLPISYISDGTQTVAPVGTAGHRVWAAPTKTKFFLILFLVAGSFTRCGALTDFCRLPKEAWTSVPQR
jgi:hypothetical protein